MKNIDEIRKMNSSELAELLSDLASCSTLECCQCSWRLNKLDGYCALQYYDEVQQWLEQEVEEYE